jgi:phosphoribosylamine---glycine ligase
MKVLVIGKGGREHALVWKLAQSPDAERIFCAPGNAGTAEEATNINLDVGDVDSLVRFARNENIGLTVVGPEEPLARGIVDLFQKQGLRIFGPTREAAQLETSKVFAKKMMRHADVPTADFVVFDHPDQAKNYIQTRETVALPDGRNVHYPFNKYQVVIEDGVKYLQLEPNRRVRVSPPEPLVVKADGLAAGKGVMVCSTTEEALDAVNRIMVKEEFGRAAGRQVVIERRMSGPEVSLLALVSGRAIVTLPQTQDHKRAFDNDEGPNTGGMGAYCPAAVASPAVLDLVDREVFVSTAHAMRRRLTPFRGVLYAGLMLTPQGLRVLEYNCRFGDPEAQALLMRLKTDLLGLLNAVVDDRLEEYVSNGIEWDARPSVCVVMASHGYPGHFEKGVLIHGLGAVAQLPDVKVFHGGTKRTNDGVVTDGGRVLGVTALGDTLEDARKRAYEAVERIRFGGAFFRRDIAKNGEWRMENGE